MYGGRIDSEQAGEACAVLARDELGDREHAHQLLDQALTTYRELGMEIYATWASALAQELRAMV